MRLAVFADIHGILPALEAALSEVDALGVDGIIVAGDAVAGPHSVETLRLLRERHCWMIRGNNENYLLQFARGDAPGWWHTSHQWLLTRWIFRQMDADSLAFLETLPEQLALELPGSQPIRVVHGSPRDGSELIYPDRDISLLDLALDLVPEPVVIFAHTHESWQMQRRGRLALNPGAVCGTFNGKLGGSYALLEQADGAWMASLHPLHYDLRLARRAFEESGMLRAGGVLAECWLNDLETGTNTVPRFVEYAFRKAAEAGYAGSPFVPDEIWDAAARSFTNRR